MEIDLFRAALADGVRCIVVTGAAGTGKTTLIRELIPELDGLRYDVKLLAPTGRAAKMVQLRTGHAASTIHSAIFRISEKPEDWTPEEGALRWVFPLKNDRPAHTAFVVDEASMVGDARHNDGILQFGTGSLLQDLLAYSGIARPHSDNLVVFVGDRFQLPPVGEKASNPPALDAVLLEERIGAKVATVQLREIHRQRAGSGILEEAQKLRMAITLGLCNAYGLCAHDDVHLLDEAEFERQYHPESRLNDKIVIAYTNARVWNFNCRIRNLLGNRHPLPVRGERLLCLRNTIVATRDGREEAFMNGDMLQVVNVMPGAPIVLKGFYRPKDGNETLCFEFTFVRLALMWLYEDDRNTAEVWANVTPILSEACRQEPEYASIALYVAVSNAIRERFGLGNSREDARKAQELLKKSTLYHAPIVTYGYAITGHKAQGGEWKTAWIDYQSPQSKTNEAYFRWMYTALTRARNHLVALSAPEFDDIAEALVRGLARTAPEHAPLAQPSCAPLPLAAILARHGYATVETIRKPYLVRVNLAKTGDPSADSGWLDLNFNGKGTVSHVKLSCVGADDDFGHSIATLKGRSMRTVFPESAPPATRPASDIAVAEPHAHIKDRLLAAAGKAGLRILALKSLTPSQLRLELASDLGEGYADFYVNAAGRVTEMGSMTIPRSGLERLKEGLCR